MTGPKIRRCDRCHRRLRQHGMETWNVVVESGYITGLVCPGCQTSEENVEAEINEATLDYCGMLSDGRLVAQPKVIRE